MEQIKAALANAQSRLNEAQSKLELIKQEAFSINVRGVEVEKDILGIEGEVKALSELGIINGD